MACCVVASASLAATNTIAAEGTGSVPKEPAPRGVLDLVDAGFLPGVLLPVAATDGIPHASLLWKSSAFLTPFEFRLDGISGVRFAPQPAPPAPAGQFSLRLRGGDVISGRILAVDDRQITIAPTGNGPDRPVRIDRGEVMSIGRRDQGDGTFVGPGGLVGWEQSPASSWREEAGRILTTMQSAAVVRDVEAPVRARYDVSLSWKKQPEFRLAVAAAEIAANDGFWLEMLELDDGHHPMLVRKEGDRAEVRILPMPEGDMLRLVLFADQTTGQLAAVLPDVPGRPEGAGREAFTVELPPQQPAHSPRFRLVLTRGDVCLESLRVSPWKTDEPTLEDVSEVVVSTREGVQAALALESFEAAGETFVFRGAEGPLRIPGAEVEEIRLPAGDESRRGRPAVRAICVDGDMVAGELVAVDDPAGANGCVWLRREGCDAAVGLPLARLVTIKSLETGAEAEPPPGRIGRLVTGDFEMQGCLVPAATGGIAWRPLGSVAGATFTAAFAGGDGGPAAATLEYVASRRSAAKTAPGAEADGVVGGIGGMVSKDAEGFFVVSMMMEDGAAARDGRIMPGDRILAIAPAPHSRFVETTDLDPETVTNLLRGRVGTPVRLRLASADGRQKREIGFRRGQIAVGGAELLAQALETHAHLAPPAPVAADGEQPGFPGFVFLRNGDVASCRIAASRPPLLRLATPLSFTPNADLDVRDDAVKAVDLIPAAADGRISAVREDRLLTLPRMQRSRPPTHLLRLVNGDYLRGWLREMDAETVRFEVVGTVQKLPRSTVASIIWLHPAGMEDAAPAGDEGADAGAADPGPPADPRGLQAVWADGRRATLVPGTLAGNVLGGESAAFGPIRLDLGEVDELRFGEAIDVDADKRPYARWRLRPAPEPRGRAQPAGAALPAPQGSGQAGPRHSSRHGSSGGSSAVQSVKRWKSTSTNPPAVSCAGSQSRLPSSRSGSGANGSRGTRGFVGGSVPASGSS